MEFVFHRTFYLQIVFEIKKRFEKENFTGIWSISNWGKTLEILFTFFRLLEANKQISVRFFLIYPHFFPHMKARCRSIAISQNFLFADSWLRQPVVGCLKNISQKVLAVNALAKLPFLNGNSTVFCVLVLILFFWGYYFIA